VDRAETAAAMGVAEAKREGVVLSIAGQQNTGVAAITLILGSRTAEKRQPPLLSFHEDGFQFNTTFNRDDTA
jgi:hypothetical protein